VKNNNCASVTKRQDGFFDTEHLTSDLKGRSVRGGAFTVLGRGVGFCLKIASVPILARLLTPQDFGLIAMVVAFTGLAAIFEQMGLSTATIQRKEINHDQVSTLFWINTALGLAIAVIVCALAPVISMIYDEPRLFKITIALSITFLLSGLTIQHRALLRRQMCFGVLGVVAIISQAAGIAVAIVAAWLGASYWALVLMNITSSATSAFGIWVAVDWRPGLPVRGSGVRSFVKFGANLTGGNLLNYCARHVDKILIGVTWGPIAVGIYSKAYEMLMMPIYQINAPMGAVAVPALSRLQDNPERFRRYFCRAISLMVAIGMPIVAFTFVAADKLVLLFLGEQWIEVTPIYRALAPAAFIGTFNVIFGWIFIPLGRVDRQLRFLVVSIAVTVVAFFIGLPWGAYGVALAFSIQAVLKRIPQIIYTFHGTPLSLIDLGKVLWQPTVSSVFAALVLKGISTFEIITAPLFLQIIIDSSIYSVTYLILSYLLPRGKDLWSEMLDLVNTLFESRIGNRTVHFKD